MAASQGPGAAPDEDLDPIFLAEEKKQKPQKSTLLLWQFFFFPVLIVVAAVGVFWLFGAIAGSAKTPSDLLEKVISGGENEQKQAAQQLAILISSERTRVQEARRRLPAGQALEEPPFYEDPGFRARLQQALELALQEESPERQQMLARALGRAADTSAIPLLLGVLYPPQGRPQNAPDTRRAAALGLAWMEDRASEGALIQAAEDPGGDEQVRAIAYNGLALLGLPQHGGPALDDPRTAGLLRKGLDDTMAGVQVNAAYGLALRGDRAGIHLLERSLDRATLLEMRIPKEYHSAALANAIRGAAELGDERLKALVEGLANENTEPDARVRQIAREAIKRWRTQ